MSLNKSPTNLQQISKRRSEAFFGVSQQHGRYNSLERTLKTVQRRGADGSLIK